MTSKVLNDQGTADELNSNALKTASGKDCLVSASKLAILNSDGRRQSLFKQVGFPERFIFWTYKEEVNFCFVSLYKMDMYNFLVICLCIVDGGP